MKPSPVTAGPATVTERAFTAMVIELARLCGWRVAHFRPSMNRRGKWSTPVQADGAGFPDLLLIQDKGHCRRIIVAELKVGKRQATLAQQKWLSAFELAGVPAYTWTPESWGEIESVLRE